ncbi:hypothetical protein N7E02_09765 [Aliirhizobium terrae]|uniref:hypothetical protein n=1 Tax=Terrirhizobium terrae TaxID=2926709 RepID=UPI00257727B1|nr:hypothetical protein [Rhizobium sp. CC-CFT758]WJH40834.1 hypothetical protein N7E02_09765 [Rhizobium sp. CC-CFT758]
MGDLNAAEIEQTKLLANAFDRASTACFTLGVVTPLAGYGYSVTAFASIPASQMLTGIASWFFTAIGLHYVARRTLKRLA